MGSETRTQRRSRARWIGGLALITVAGVAAPVTIAQVGSTPPEPEAPAASVVEGGDQQLAAEGDAGAAERILQAGGWRPLQGTLRVVAAQPATGGVGAYALWTYDGKGGPAQLLIGAKDPLGGVHTDCLGGPVVLRACGNAVATDSHALVVGSAGPGVSRVGVRQSDGTEIAATVGSGSWFARLPASAGAPLPRSFVAYSPSGAVMTSIAADLLRDSITFRPAVPDQGSSAE